MGNDTEEFFLPLIMTPPTPIGSGGATPTTWRQARRSISWGRGTPPIWLLFELYATLRFRLFGPHARSTDLSCGFL